MREIMLMVHFIGLTMGLGTSFGFMFLGFKASKMEKEEAHKFMLNTFILSNMGKTGIVLLVLSGGYLITPFLSMLSSMPLLIAKLSLVVVLIVIIVLLDIASKKAKKGNFLIQLKRIRILGQFSMLTALSIVVLAVLTFS